MNTRMRIQGGAAPITGCRRRTASALRNRLWILAVTGLTQCGVGFDLSWSTIDGGGAKSVGGGFELSGTIGQADATPKSALTGGSFALTGGFWYAVGPLCSSFAAPDFDLDCDVDPVDLAALQSCASGPAVPYNAGCGGKDLDVDGDVDQTDFGLWQRCFSGENVVADPACMS